MAITRRTFAGLAAATLMGAASAALSSCGAPRGTNAGTADASSTGGTTGANPAPAQTTSQTPTTDGGASDALVVYFSRAGENYGVGRVSEGNTAVVAKMIAEATGAPTFEIAPENAYPDGYDECCDVARAEQSRSERPAYQGDVDTSAAKTVYLGYPIWRGDLPMCVYTFLERHDWAGKTIRPFCTHAGSGLSGTPAKIAATCPAATVADALAIEGTTAQNDRDTARSRVTSWLG